MRLLGTAGVLLAAALALGGCAEPTTPAVAPTAGSTASPTPGPAGQPLRVTTDPAGSDGLTVRYRDADGRLQTLPVEDFRR